MRHPWMVACLLKSKPLIGRCLTHGEHFQQILSNKNNSSGGMAKRDGRLLQSRCRTVSTDRNGFEGGIRATITCRRSSPSTATGSKGNPESTHQRPRLHPRRRSRGLIVSRRKQREEFR